MRGIDKFKERFTGHDGEYVLIGGGACDLLFGEAGQDFRATKDLDLVLLVEALTPEFELPPISWTREMGGFLMRTDLRVKHDAETRRLAAELFADGLGRAAAAKRLSVPEAAVRKWQQIYRAFGSEVLLTMDGKQARYTYEQKVAAARAVVEDGVARPAAMAEFGIMSMAPLDRWCRLYREGGAEALRPKPKGRPKGSKAKPRELTREQELEERCRRLETEVAYLKKLRALVERDGL